MLSSKTINERGIFWAIIAVKALALIIFSSDYQNKLFIPFVSHFLDNFDNPWEYFYRNDPTMEFPYSSGMLYILSAFYTPIHWLGLKSVFIQNFFFKLPTLIADCSIFYLLSRIFYDKRQIIIYYFATPIIFYACYMHSQIDLIPTAMLFFSVYLLTQNRIGRSSLMLGLAVCTKFHVIAAMPLMLIYVLKKHQWEQVLKFLVAGPALFFFFMFPYFSEGYTHLVLNNPKQMLVYDAFITIGEIKIYLAVLFVVIFYARYSAFRRINNDLLYTFLALVFAAFVAFTVPAPGWYVWLFPFLSIFFIKFQDRTRITLKLFIVLNAAYLVYMAVFYIPEFQDLIFVHTPLSFKIPVEKMRNLSFTFLEVVLMANMYVFYKFGIKSNFFYKRNSATMIGIAGDSAAGKTTLLEDVKKLLGQRVLDLEGDADHKWERGDTHWQELTHLNPKANFLHRQYEDIVNLKLGKVVFRSDYDHTTGKFATERKIKADDYIILSGLHSFYLPKMRKLIDLKIYIDTDERLRQHWKVMRDHKDRGHSVEKVLEQIDERQSDAQKYIHPQNEFADIVIRYFTDKEFKVGDPDAEVPLKLKVIFDSSVAISSVVGELEGKINVEWDYAQDLKTQSLVIDGHLDHHLIRQLAQKVIINPEELVGENPYWMDGYRGFVQLMILLILGEKMKVIGEGSEHTM